MIALQQQQQQQAAPDTHLVVDAVDADGDFAMVAPRSFAVVASSSGALSDGDGSASGNVGKEDASSPLRTDFKRSYLQYLRLKRALYAVPAFWV
jgi:hypothetical protein